MTSFIDDWLGERVADERLRPLDRAFARFLATLDEATDRRVLMVAALASRQLGDGHICVDMLELARDEGSTFDGWDAWLLRSALVGRAGEAGNAPLVLDGQRLYLRRYWRYEGDVAAIIGRRLGPAIEAQGLSAELTRLFPRNGDRRDWQKIACAIAARSAFSVITGGPGTGKTTTVVRLLGLLQTLALRSGEPRLRIRLAAPTGKAAARLNESIAGQIERLAVDDDVKAAIPAEVTTLHRLLGSRPDTRHFRHNRDNPLHLDVLVVDEASMIDLEMMAAVLDALPDDARLILLGDKDQLSSVEAGAVLGDLCARAEVGHYSMETGAWIARTCAETIDEWVDPADARALDQHVVMLRESHRFGAGSGIGALATAVNAGDVKRVGAVLAEDHADLHTAGAMSIAAIAALAIDGRGDAVGYGAYLQWMHAHRPSIDALPGDVDAWARGVLDAFANFQLLCAVRHGDEGTTVLNEAIAHALRERDLIPSGQGWYEGRPVLVARNDYGLGLMNGDVGIALAVPDGQGGTTLRVVFRVAAEAGGDRIRYVVPSRLASVETVFAMTVHKSQGSEFVHAALVLPAQISPVLTRELLYTGVTRARRHFTLLASREVLDVAVTRRTRRSSGLLERLL
ncbi:DNA helicase/exodeoxyribonuclease V alpha subunit [Luteibacter rhizovicinus]|uniref:RecBCD enzyme subunit RecD n=1 Tax=Luteibacter rhizovicinus TaxID=242606 RepID=A0A4R3YR34_9GAMM|nr:exodeoxyribonuclease V subunit alpha [Luteibacter rhizovicinus]TCV94900.1 DNA helicase/exodeoxyribonuclease V alpha subunit [Luteibacter rhizovicinus]